MKIAFTLCSNNYLAHAKTLGDSFLAHHPDFMFCIGLVDKVSPQLQGDYLSNFTVIPVEELHMPDFPSLLAKYNITELNTAVKPAYYHYLFLKYKAGVVMYIDPDILVTSRFEEVFTVLQEKNIVITPHLLSPIDDEYSPTDYETLRGGVFNLGFIALSEYDKVKAFLNWWHERVIKYGYANLASNMFYDQLWINYVPTFYDNYFILKHPGYNMAHWNLHERIITSSENEIFIVNEKYPLRFYHFSGYKYTNPNIICSYANRFSFESRPDLKPIFSFYQSLLTQNKVDEIKKLQVAFYPDLAKSKAGRRKVGTFGKITNRLNHSLRILLYGDK